MTGGLAFGIYDATSVLEADWIGLPAIAYPGLDLGFGPAFWALLPAFVVLTVVGAMDTLGDGIAIQRVSWRKPRANRLPVHTGRDVGRRARHTCCRGSPARSRTRPTPRATAIVELTGVASRAVGACIGMIFVVIAFIPKFAAVIIAIPGPVVAAYYVLPGSAAVHLRHQDPPARPARLPERARRRPRVLARSCVSARLDLPPVLPGAVERAAGQRHDRRRPDRDIADAVRGIDGAAAASACGWR